MNKFQQGDICMESVTAIPATAQLVPVVNGRYVIAHGESGNTHVLDATEGMELFQDGETLYLRRTTLTGTLVHEGPSRHHLPMVLPEAPLIRFRKVREFDHLQQLVGPVRD